MKFVAIAILALTLSTAVICPCAGGAFTDLCATCTTPTSNDCATCKAGSGLSGTPPANINCVACTGDQVTASDSKLCTSSCLDKEFKDTTAKTCRACSIIVDCIACSAFDRCTKCGAGKYLQVDMKTCGAGCAAGQTKDDTAGTCRAFGALKFALGAIALLLALLF